MKIVGYATGGEKVLFVIGHICAAIMGTVLPMFQIFFAEQIDAFGEPDQEKQFELVKKNGIIMICMAAGMWVIGYIYWVCLATFSNKVANRIKILYLEAILR